VNQGTYNGWLDTSEHWGLTWKAAKYDLARIGLDQKLADFQADAAFDAGFEAGVEAQKHGLGEIPLS
jgi:hypothetical protein